MIERVWESRLTMYAIMYTILEPAAATTEISSVLSEQNSK